MTTTDTPLETIAPTATIELEEGGHVAIVSYRDRVGMQVRNEQYAAFVFLTPGQPGAVATLLQMASKRITHPEVGAAIDAGDVQEAAQAFLEHLDEV